MPSGPLDVLIVGAGWSGLTAALQLSKAGKNVVCVEARKRIGGRAFTHSWNDKTPMESSDRTVSSSVEEGGEGYTVDFGCSYIHGYEEGNPVKEIAKRYGVNVHTFKPAAMQIIDSKGVAVPKTLNDKLSKNLQSAQAAMKEFAQEQRLSQSSSKSSPSSTSSIASFLLDEKNSPLFSDLDSEAERSQAKKLVRMLHIPMGTEIENVSLEHWGYEKNFAGTDGMPEGGFSRLMAELAKDIESSGGRIQLGKVVRKITRVEGQQGSGAGGGGEGGGGGGVVQIEIADAEGQQGEILQAKTAIVTMPLAVLQSSPSSGNLFQPALDPPLREAIEKTTVGNLNKVLLTYKKAFWSADVGTFIVLPEGEPSSGPASLQSLIASNTLIVNSLCAANTGLPDHTKSSSLLVMIGGKAGKELEKFARIEVAQALDSYLASRLASRDGSKDDKPELQHTFYSRWGRQEFTGGATTTPVTIGNHPDHFNTLAQPQWNDTLYLCGEHTEINHRGSIAGAVVSAQRTSDNVLAYLSSSSVSSTATTARH